MKQVIDRLRQLCEEFADDVQGICGPDIQEEARARQLELIVATYTGAMDALVSKHREQQERIADNSKSGAEKVYR